MKADMVSACRLLQPAGLRLGAAVLHCCGQRVSRVVSAHVADAGNCDAAHRRAALLLPARRVRGPDAGLGGVLGRPERELHRFEAARALSRGADGLRHGAGHEGAVRGAGDHHRRGVERVVRHFPVRRAAVRQPWPAPARVARPLHDVLGRADAGHVRRRRRAFCSRASVSGPRS